jgi:hypothetical protein
MSRPTEEPLTNHPSDSITEERVEDTYVLVRFPEFDLHAGVDFSLAEHEPSPQTGGISFVVESILSDTPRLTIPGGPTFRCSWSSEFMSSSRRASNVALLEIKEAADEDDQIDSVPSIFEHIVVSRERKRKRGQSERLDFGNVIVPSAVLTARCVGV